LLKAREAVSKYELRKHGVKLDPATNVTFSMKGSRMIYPFLLEIILDRLQRNTVILPIPFYPGHVSAVRRAGGRAVFVPATSAREFVNGLEEKLRQGLLPAAVVVSSIGNPLGYRYNSWAFNRLVGLAHQYGFKLVVDEAYAELAYDGTATASPLEAEDALQVTLITMTASKFLSAAAAGIGILIGTPDLIGDFNSAVGDLSEGGNGLVQSAFGFTLPHCDAYVRDLAKKYADRATDYSSLLFQAGLHNAVRGVGDGGMFLWTPTDDVDADLLADRAEEEGVIVRPGRIFLDTGDSQRPSNMNFLRICLRENMSVAERSFALLRPIITALRLEKCAPNTSI
jgi:aspartate/methionine/tyrosine aminotransferase